MHLFVLAFAALVLLLLYHQLVLRRKHLPPGPVPLPLLGNVLQIDFSDQVAYFGKLGKKYGGMYTLYLGPSPTVFITDYDVLKEAFVGNSEAFAGRPENVVENFFREGKYGLAMSDGPLWREHRRFALHTLRDFGVSRNLMEDKINYDVNRLTEHIKLTIDRGEEVDIHHSLSVCVGSVIANLILGQRYEYDDEKFVALRKMLEELFALFTTTLFLLDEFSWLQYVPLFGHFGFDAVKEGTERSRVMFEAILEKRKAEIEDKPSDEPEDYVEAYVKERQLRKEPGDDRLRDSFSDWQLYVCAFDLWGAGFETTANTLHWAIGYMCANPHVQERVHSEIVEQIGLNAPVTMVHKQKLPYTNAVINEVQRIANILVINIPHLTTEDVTLRGYHIKKDTLIQGMISAVLWDDELYPNAKTFDPERFMPNNKYAAGKNPVDALVPFSMGKRSCLGEPLARMELLLIFTALVQQFQFAFASEHEAAQFADNISASAASTQFVRRSYKYKVHVTART